MNSILLSSIAELAKTLETVYAIKFDIHTCTQNGTGSEPYHLIDAESTIAIVEKLIDQCITELSNLKEMVVIEKPTPVSMSSQIVRVCKGSCADCDC